MNLGLTDPLRGVFFFRFGTETEPSERFNDQTQVRPRLRTWVALHLMLIIAGSSGALHAALGQCLVEGRGTP
jgi:hypothetical protein